MATRRGKRDPPQCARGIGAPPRAAARAASFAAALATPWSCSGARAMHAHAPAIAPVSRLAAWKLVSASLERTKRFSRVPRVMTCRDLRQPLGGHSLPRRRHLRPACRQGQCVRRNAVQPGSRPAPIPVSKHTKRIRKRPTHRRGDVITVPTASGRISECFPGKASGHFSRSRGICCRASLLPRLFGAAIALGSM